MTDVLVAAGTSDGARRAWESRKRGKAGGPSPAPVSHQIVYLDGTATQAEVTEAFTLHGTLYDAVPEVSAHESGWTVYSKLYSKDGDEIGEASRSLSSDGSSVYHDSMDIEPDQQGKGIGAEFLRDSVAMYAAHGVDNVKVTAVSSMGANGAYTWARLGFELDPNPAYHATFANKMIAADQHAPWQPSSDNPFFGASIKSDPTWIALSERIRTGTAGIQDVLAHPKGKDFLLGKLGSAAWHGILPVKRPALAASVNIDAEPVNTDTIDYDEWEACETSRESRGDPMKVADTEPLTASVDALVDDETERDATRAIRAAYRAAIDLVAPRVLARLQSGGATNRALAAAADDGQVITDAEWAALAYTFVDDSIGDAVLDGVVAGASQFKVLATPSSVLKAFISAANAFASFAGLLRSKVDTWIGNKIGQDGGDWGLDRVIEELAKDSPLSQDKADYVVAAELQAGVNAGLYASMEVAPPAAMRWVSMRDEKVRSSHVAADSETVPFGEMFEVGGYPARYPGDPNLPPGERYGCRCSLVPVDGTEARRVVGATKAELRTKAASLSITGRSTMNKGQLQSAVLNKLCLQGMAGGPDCPDVFDKWNRTALLAAARGEGITGRYRMSREELVYQLRQTVRGGDMALTARGYSTRAEFAAAQKRASFKQGRSNPGEFATGVPPSPAARRGSRDALFAEFGGDAKGSVPCVHCGLRLHADPRQGLAVLVPEPIVPWSQGGTLALSNLVPSCAGCFRHRGGRGLVAAGTSEGARKAWESRARKNAAPTLAEQAAALTKYHDQSFQLNLSLRGLTKATPADAAQLATLDALMSAHTVPTDTLSHRVVDDDDYAAKVRALNVGDTLTEDAFTSTTLDEDLLADFETEAGTRTTLHITSPAGTHAVDVKAVVGDGEYYYDQAELLLDRQARLVIDGKNVARDGSVVVHAHVAGTRSSGLTAAGTSEGARKAWETRQRAANRAALREPVIKYGDTVSVSTLLETVVGDEFDWGDNYGARDGTAGWVEPDGRITVVSQHRDIAGGYLGALASGKIRISNYVGVNLGIAAQQPINPAQATTLRRLYAGTHATELYVDVVRGHERMWSTMIAGGPNKVGDAIDEASTHAAWVAEHPEATGTVSDIAWARGEPGTFPDPLTAAGTSDGARKAWESRARKNATPTDDRGPVGTAHMFGNVHSEYSPAMFDQVIEGTRLLMAADVATGTGALPQALTDESSGAWLDPHQVEMLAVYRGDQAAMRRMADSRRAKSADVMDDYPPTTNPAQIAAITKAVATLDGEPAMQVAVARFGRVPIVVVADAGLDVAGRYMGNWMMVRGNTISASHPLQVMRPAQQPGNKIVDPSATGTLRHEYGHHVQKMLTSDEASLWQKAHEQGKVSKYAAFHPDEGFAETFAFVVHPGFKYADVKPNAKAPIDAMLRILKVQP